MARKVGTIAEDTVLLPWVVADAVIREACCLNVAVPPVVEGDTLRDRLSEKADRVYVHNPQFRSKMRSRRGDTCREYLYMYMRHWCASFLLRDHGIRMPQDWALGEAPRP